MSDPTYYDVLCVSQTSSAEEIKASYRKLVLKCHPDKVAGKENEFRLLQRAWNALSSAEERAIYDSKLRDQAIVANTASSNHLEIDIDDMEFDEGRSVFTAPCRCGSNFEISEDELDAGDADIECTGCSLRATVMYDIADSEDDGASEEVGDSAETKEQATANGAGPAP